jgi:tetratricopeptide (TPR) repeat protein
MAKKPKKTRKQLLKEPDEFITFSSKMIKLAVEYKTQLAWALAITLALVVIISGQRFFSIRSEQKASLLLEQSLSEYNRIKATKSPAEVYDDVSADFQLILKKYGGKENGKLARLIFANICYDAGKYQQAIELYKISLTDFKMHPVIFSQVLNSLGYACEQIKDHSAAVGYFEQVSTTTTGLMRAEALYHLGRLYSFLEQPAKSKEAYNSLLSDHQDFIYIEVVKERVSG